MNITDHTIVYKYRQACNSKVHNCLCPSNQHLTMTGKLKTYLISIL